jgi:phosphohistidine swiveling domain-containing protein
MNLEDFKHGDWITIYEINWSFLSCSHYGDQYTKEIIFGPRPFESQSIIFCSKGRSTGWMRQSERDILGNYTAKQIQKHPQLAKALAKRLKSQVKSFLAFMIKHENTVATEKLYREFWRRLLVYYHPHINVKYVVDYLHPDLLKKYLPGLESARLAAEPVFHRTEEFMESFVKILSKHTNYHHILLLCLTKGEMYKYFKTGKLPKKSELQQRYNRAVWMHDKKSGKFNIGKGVAKVEKIVHAIKSTSEVKGAVAYKGKVTGTARVVVDPSKAKNFRKGDILIAGSTRPDFIPIMNKAAAFVTDTGGILSHAAITSREMKKPCIIGTKIATRIFKDNDLVEVDADKGIVRKVGK